jgi:hypothetical protein
MQGQQPSQGQQLAQGQQPPRPPTLGETYNVYKAHQQDKMRQLREAREQEREEKEAEIANINARYEDIARRSEGKIIAERDAIQRQIESDNDAEELRIGQILNDQNCDDLWNRIKGLRIFNNEINDDVLKETRDIIVELMRGINLTDDMKASINNIDESLVGYIKTDEYKSFA